MSIVYLLQNQHDHYLNRAGEWVNGDTAASLFRTAHKDEAINQKVEYSVKQIDQRIRIVEAELDEKRLPIVEVTAEPSPTQLQAKEAKSASHDEDSTQEVVAQTTLLEDTASPENTPDKESTDQDNVTTDENDIREAV